MTASLQCPIPKVIMNTKDYGRTFRCEMYWEEGPPVVQWTLPNNTNLVISSVSFEEVRNVYFGDFNITTSFYMNPEGFTCCYSTSLNHSKVENTTDNFVGKTVSSLTVSPILLQQWRGELVSCTSLFTSGEVNTTACLNVTSFNIDPGLITTEPYTTEIQTRTGKSNNQIIYLLNSDMNDNISTFHLDLVITTLLTSSVVALSFFLILVLKKGTYKIWKVDNVQDQNQNVDPDRLSQHAYETVEDQYEVIRDSQIEEDDVITPYGQATMAGAYGMDTPMTAAVSRPHITKHRRVDSPYPKRKIVRTQSVAESSYNLQASRRVDVTFLKTHGAQKGTCQAYNRAEIREAEISNGRGSLIVRDDDFREIERTTWL
uniref:Uncharacterized protein n=1 Tax=Branchiostoma floridae TaxID=7739 RepID=C3ZF90_BRAFL|eukprot:XP_002593385.1 hypothetical protein BRAFLDRAFT_70845 [Branchiostoma floridae]